MPLGGPVSLPSGVTAARVAKRVVDRAERKRPDPPIDAAGRGLSPAPLSRVALMTKQRRPLPHCQVQEQPYFSTSTTYRRITLYALSR